ncbi:YihA family ribosome biogenesis GTP-binding protein [Neoehrlichia mikurensis]|uniref:Probable GTP-binding protein EngB n=1 Tax=Neoehrlichia mikurensis TaxID=89586 RepID=A0A9Q9BTT3_9RICK|nr:ribosome biogenesis GTP-binding protein YihA/YsxC [Neoehrlichia mikurensis]QXK92422.1 YihA family ribosome biogenesis GTP-binding protein [Neoehrlichia mikurensis]QXK93268.1 YihA family ribosome biogenesis GTP-binding protein [Neoehrlichia mikurensis]QXK94112.1 YihA family ribosome biogenesis GTP-binding protein [Neoehrlichia mikurensis]UTO55975.1 ribosome biogenesis GTP-binding protein YihA/YsxC [Neoehrlichia mikurensis]UTO56890.1 ribosome biogenesis GTP-binding protein YihA/YsxC [Neoehrli
MLDCKFVIGAINKSSFPNSLVPETAIVGRSNVGKSSLINAITKNKKNAKVSSLPGCTKQINFYLINQGSMMLVDLPGYGYSKAGKNLIINYINLMEYYLLHRENLQKLILLIDSRIGLKEIDLDFINWLEIHQIFYYVVLTKIDKVSCEKLSDILCIVKKKLLGLDFLLDPIMTVSSKDRKGIKELVYYIIK